MLVTDYQSDALTSNMYVCLLCKGLKVNCLSETSQSLALRRNRYVLFYNHIDSRHFTLIYFPRLERSILKCLRYQQWTFNLVANFTDMPFSSVNGGYSVFFPFFFHCLLITLAHAEEIGDEDGDNMFTLVKNKLIRNGLRSIITFFLCMLDSDAFQDSKQLNV